MRKATITLALAALRFDGAAAGAASLTVTVRESGGYGAASKAGILVVQLGITCFANQLSGPF